jgi:hypothetical protein
MKSYYKKLKNVGLVFIGLCCIIMQAQAQSQTGLLYHYSFDGSLSNTAGTHTMTGGTNFVADRFNFSPSAYFVQTNTDIISSAGIPDLPTGGAARTVSFWFQTPTTSGNYHLFNYGVAGNGFFIAYNNSNGTMSVGDGVTYALVASLGASTAWRHVAVTYENNSFVLYVNGVQKNQAYLTLNTAANPVSRIGKDAGTTQTSNFKIDDLFIYNRALAIDDITTLYNKRCLPDPVATLTTDSICPGQTAHINFDKYISLFTTSDANVPLTTFSNSYTTQALTSTTTYYMQAGAGTCVSKLVPVTIPVKAKATTPINTTDLKDYNLCGSRSTTLSVQSNASYTTKWYNVSTGGTALATGANFTTPLLTSTTLYYVSNEGPNVCPSNRTTINVEVYTRPVANLTASATSICPGEEVTFSGFQYATFNLYRNNAWVAGGDSYSGPHSSYKDTPQQTSTYVLSVGEQAGCLANDTVTVTVKALPNVSISPATSAICAGQSVTLTASGATSYVWSTSATTATITASPTTSTTYKVTGTKDGCSKEVSRTVTVKELPNVSISPASTSICDGQSTTLTASGATTYYWSTYSSAASITVSPNVTSTYTVFGTSDGCSKEVTATVTVKASPTVVVTPTAASICNGESTTLTASGATTYSWSNAATTATITPSPTATTTYTVTGTSNGCSKTASATVTVKASPAVAITPAAVSVCEGETTTLTASGATAYSWSTSATTATITTSPTTSTTYTVIGTSNGCSKAVNTTINVNTIPVPVISQSGNVLSTDTYNTYQWMKDQDDITGATSQWYQVDNSGEYVVYVSDEYGCTATSAPFNVQFTGLTNGYNTLKSMKVYPNPASSVLQISSLQETKINIINMLGESFGSFAVQSGENVLSIDHLNPGIYILQTEKGESLKLTKE